MTQTSVCSDLAHILKVSWFENRDVSLTQVRHVIDFKQVHPVHTILNK